MRFHATNSPESIARLIDDTEEYLTDQGAPFETVHAGVLCVEEIVVNILKHGEREHKDRQGAAPLVEVEIKLQPDRLIIDISDDTCPFDPTTAETPDHIDASLDDRPIGGLGIHLVKTMTDEICYSRVDDRNHLRLVRKFKSDSSPPD